MSVIIAVFAFDVADLSGEARLMPFLLICFMALVNVLQYALAMFQKGKVKTILPMLQGYPFMLVGKLLLVTVLYICTLLPLGFYMGSFVYLLVGTLLANPVPLTVRIVLMRTLGCALFVGAMYALFTVGLGVLIPMGTLWP